MKQPAKRQRPKAAPVPPTPAFDPQQQQLTMPTQEQLGFIVDAWRAHFQAQASAMSVEGRHPLPMMIGAVIAIGRLVDIVAGSNPTNGDGMTESLVTHLRRAVLDTREAAAAAPHPGTQALN